MKYCLTRKTKNPSRSHIGDAGIDIYVPQFTNQFIEDLVKINQENIINHVNFLIDKDKLYIEPHSRLKLPTGVYFDIPQDNMLLVLEKTSIPYQTGIISGARVIDHSYRGQFIASLINTSDVMSILYQNQKFIQLVLVPINKDYSLEQQQTLGQLYKDAQQSTRGQGGFGSTGLF